MRTKVLDANQALAGISNFQNFVKGLGDAPTFGFGGEDPNVIEQERAALGAAAAMMSETGSAQKAVSEIGRFINIFNRVDPKEFQKSSMTAAMDIINPTSSGKKGGNIGTFMHFVSDTGVILENMGDAVKSTIGMSTETEGTISLDQAAKDVADLEVL